MTATPGPGRDDLDKLERKHAEHPEGRYFVPLANAYRRAGEVDRAITVLRTGLRTHPDYLSARVVLGRCLLDAGRNGEAADEFGYVLAHDPQNLIALRALGDLALAAGEIEESRARYQALLDVDPLNPEARAALDALAMQPGTVDAHFAEPEEFDEGPFGGGRFDDERFGAGPLDVDHAPGEIAPPAPESGDEDHDALFGTMINLDDGPGSPEPGDRDAVVTETIAELYTRQGFYDRAAGVYRELIRRRGAEERLVQALERVEGLARGAASAQGSDRSAGESGGARGEEVQAGRGQEGREPVEVEAEEEAGATFGEAAAEAPILGEDGAAVAWAGADTGDAPSSDAFAVAVATEDDPFADSFADGFPTLEAANDAQGVEEGGIVVEEVEDAPETAATEITGEDGAASEAPGTIRDLLISVIGWTPGAGAHSPVDQAISEPEEPAEAAGSEEAYADETSGESVGLDAATDDEEDALTAAPLSPEEMEETGAVPASAEDVLFPWELPPAGEEGTPATLADEGLEADSGAPPADEEDASPFGSAPSARAEDAGPPEASSPESAAPPASDEAPEPVEGPAPSDESSSPDEEDEDDLESFQEWLRSLRR